MTARMYIYGKYGNPQAWNETKEANVYLTDSEYKATRTTKK